MPRRFNTTQPIGQRLLQAELTVEDLSRSTGISSRTLSDYLAGRLAIRAHHAPILATALSCEPLDLYGDADVAALTAVVEQDARDHAPTTQRARHNLYA